MKSYTLYLIRHIRQDSDYDGKYIGLTNVSCDKKALQELKENKDEYPPVDSVFSSPLLRALQTASIIYPDKDIKVVEELTEYDFGAFENKTPERIIASTNAREYGKWLKGGLEARPPAGDTSGESAKEFTLRIVSGLNNVILELSKIKGNTAAIITHGGVISSLLCGFGLPKLTREQSYPAFGGFFEIRVDIALWQRGTVFEIVL